MSEVIFSPRSMISFKYVGNKEALCRDHKIDTLVRTRVELGGTGFGG